jgi:hypothetical protein
MANLILAEHTAVGALTITLADGTAGLASSVAGVGRQSTIVSNTDNFQIIHIFVAVTVGTTPTIDTNIFVYLIKSDGTLRSDSAGATDAGWTALNASLLGVIRNPSISSDVQYQGEFTIYNPGIEWGIGIVHDTGVDLNVTAANSLIRYVGENQEVQ